MPACIRGQEQAINRNYSGGSEESSLGYPARFLLQCMSSFKQLKHRHTNIKKPQT